MDVRNEKLSKFVRLKYAGWMPHNLLAPNEEFIKLLEEECGFTLKFSGLYIDTGSYKIIDEQKFLICALRDFT